VKLDLPILAIGGGAACGKGVENEMRLVASAVQGVVIPSCRHFAPEEAPEAFTAALPERVNDIETGCARV
jgi:pimeloyl-ACP methyl ester carboxylesterase